MRQDSTILIADDDAAVRNIVVTIAREVFPSAHITAVENGRQALDFYRENGADLVISNFIMPEMNGPSFVRILRSTNDKVPVIMVSGSPEAEALGRKAGIDRFVPKIDLLSELPKAMRALMGGGPFPCRCH